MKREDVHQYESYDIIDGTFTGEIYQLENFVDKMPGTPIDWNIKPDRMAMIEWFNRYTKENKNFDPFEEDTSEYVYGKINGLGYIMNINQLKPRNGK